MLQKHSSLKAMNQTTSDLTYNYSHHYEIDEEQAVPSHQLSSDDIQLQANSCYQIANTGRITEQDKENNNFVMHDGDSINQLHQNCAYVGLRESKQKAQRTIPKNQTNNQDVKKNKNKKVKICLFAITVINIVLLSLALSAIGLSVVTYKRLLTASAEAILVPMQLDSNNNEEPSIETQLNQTQLNIYQALAELNTSKNEIMILQEQLDAIGTNLTQVLLSLDAINNTSQENVKQLASLQLQLHCGAGEWLHVIFINMSDPLNQCPPSWVEENVDGVRACGRGTTGPGCLSTTFNTGGQQYRRVCGRAIGYQHGHPDAFNSLGTFNDVYVDGLSITYGTPRQHIWTYAAAVTEALLVPHRNSNCPCASEPGASPPPIVANNYYCESGNPDPVIPSPNVLSNDPLWDGENCEGTCCSSGKSPPWFSVELPEPTNDMIEARLCGNEHSDSAEDVLINIFEIYVQ